MKNSILTILLVLISFFTFSQNLVMNPSFEDYYDNVENDVKLSKVQYWKLIKVSAYYYNTKLSYFPNSSLGYQDARTGDACIELELVDDDAAETGGLIQGHLTETLKANVCYYGELYLNLYENGNSTTSDIYMFFSDTTFEPKLKNACYQRLVPQIANAKDNFISDKTNWVKISGTFKAKGGEKYILLGNNTKTTTLSNYNNKHKGLFYFIDDVLVKELPFCPEDYVADSTMTFNNLNFETGKAIILESSFEDLNKLAEYLKLFTEQKIEISGHTDNVGTEAKNQTLSEDRAKAVADYLISQGVEKERITSAGYGSKKPIADNSTDTGKAKNRRVEFKLIKN